MLLRPGALPHVRKFFADYIDPARHELFYRPSSRVWNYSVDRLMRAHDRRARRLC